MMLNKAISYYHDAKWLHRTFSIIGILLGIYILIHAYYHLNSNIRGNISLLILSGSLFVTSGILDLTKKSLNTILLSALSAVIALVLYLFH